MGGRGGTYRVLVVVGGEYHFGRERHRREDNIKIDYIFIFRQIALN
jgi:hypothetical protein